jgi:hypothetical protein
VFAIHRQEAGTEATVVAAGQAAFSAGASSPDEDRIIKGAKKVFEISLVRRAKSRKSDSYPQVDL